MKRILNVGCGDDTYGTDFIDVYPLRPAVVKCDVSREKFPYKNDTFDEVYAKCIFEHLSNQGQFLDECFRVLKKGGEIRVITDNANCVRYAFNPVHLGGYDRDHGNEDRHYALFTKSHLKNHLEKAGFKSIEISYEQLYSNNFVKRWLTKALEGLIVLALEETGKRLTYCRIIVEGKK